MQPTGILGDGARIQHAQKRVVKQEKCGTNTIIRNAGGWQSGRVPACYAVGVAAAGVPGSGPGSTPICSSSP